MSTQVTTSQVWVFRIAPSCILRKARHLLSKIFYDALSSLFSFRTIPPLNTNRTVTASAPEGPVKQVAKKVLKGTSNLEDGDPELSNLENDGPEYPEYSQISTSTEGGEKGGEIGQEEEIEGAGGFDMVSESMSTIQNEDYEHGAIAQLQANKPLGDRSVQTYCQTLVQQYNAKGNYPNQVQTIDAFLMLTGSRTFPPNWQTTLIDSDKLLIPIVLKGTFRDHIVAVLYDRRANTLEYYDPKGLTIEDRSSAYLANKTGGRLMLSKAIAEILLQYGNNRTQIKENTAKHQWDSHNCGVYVGDYFARRLAGESFDDITTNPGKSDTLRMRQKMIDVLAVSTT